MEPETTFFESFSARAKRTIFFARAQALSDRSQQITPEHILRGLLKEDPGLFAVITPERANPAIELESLLVPDVGYQPPEKPDRQELLLSDESKEVVRAAWQERNRLGHKAVGTQHLLLALLVTPRRRKSWFRRGQQRNDSQAKQVLLKYGLSAASVEERIREGIVTPLTLVLDDAIVKLNAQLTAIVELMISKGIFTRSDYVAMLDRNADAPKPESFLVLLVESLRKSEHLTAAEKEKIESWTRALNG